MCRRQDSLALEAVPDELMGEQTWPSETEMHLGEEAGTAEGAGRLRRKLPGEVLQTMAYIHACSP